MTTAPDTLHAKLLGFVDRHAVWIAALITVLALVVRALGLGTYWLNPDEGIYFSIAATRDPALWRGELAANAHPPLFYLLLRGLAAVSHELWVLRLPSMLCGTATVWVLFLLGRDAIGGAAGKLTGLLAAFACAIFSGTVVMSEVMRPYAMLMLLLAASVWFLVRQIEHGGVKNALGYSLCSAVALLTHYSAAMALAAAGIVTLGIVLVRRAGRRRVLEIAAAQLLPIVTGLALYFLHVRPKLAGSKLEKESFATWLSPFFPSSPADHWDLLAGDVHWLAGISWTGTVTVLLVAGLILAIAKRRAWAGFLPLVLLLIAHGAATAGQYPVGSGRHGSYMMPFLVLAIAYPVASGLTRSPRTAILALVLLALSLVLRGPLFTAVSRNRRLIPGTGSEQQIPIETIQVLRPVMQRLRETPGPLVAHVESFFLMLPFWIREREDAQIVEGMRRFRWGRRDVVVHSEWTFAVSPSRIDSPAHLYRFVEKTNRLFPDVRLEAQPKVWMLMGGFGWEAVIEMYREDQKRQPQDRLMGMRLGQSGLFLFEYDLGRFVREWTDILKRR